MYRYKTLEEILVSTAEAIRPPERLTVPEAAEKYRKLNNPGSYVGHWDNTIAPYLTEIMCELTSHEFTGLIFAGPARCGKALALDTPVPTPTGWTTMGELQVGDVVFDECGEPVKVLATSEIMYDHQCYVVEFSDGERIVADAGHLWRVSDAHRPNGHRILTTEELKGTYRYGSNLRSRYWVDLAHPLHLPDVDLPMDPYVLGAWLGDGHSRGPRIFAAKQDAEEMVKLIEDRGYITEVTYRRFDGFATIKFDRGDCGRLFGIEQGRYWRSKSSAELLSMEMGHGGLIGKHIPMKYLRASHRQRLDLLRGLMDTDGYVDDRGVCELVTSNAILAEGIRDLLSGLSIKFTETGKNTVHRFQFKPGFQVFNLPRKAARLKNSPPQSVRCLRRYIINIEPVESVPVRCIKVASPNSLFLVGRRMVPTHNSDIFFNWLAHTAICDPADMLLVHMTQGTARDWSIGDLRRAFRHTPALGAKVIPGRHNMNVHDIRFLSGMRLLVKWPTITELSGKTVPRVWLMDYDRMPQDVDKEGPPFDLGRKRTQTFGRYGMTVAESSPGFEIDNPRWMPNTAHEAPPTQGILALYNRGDRRRWYWRCAGCKKAFEGDFKLLRWPDSKDHLEAAEAATLECPHCGFQHTHEAGPGQPGKHELNLNGRWIKDGQRWDDDGKVVGQPIVRSDIASFWLKGTAAAFASWKDIVFKYLKATEEFERTGDMAALKATINTDQGLPFLAPSLAGERLPEDLKSRARNLGDRVVPEGVRFLIATIDVQKHAFVVQVHGFGVGNDVTIIDRFSIKKSKRQDEDHPELALWVNPATYIEDWYLLVQEVIERSYPLDDDSGRRMAIRAVGCDSGGREGVTANAYAFWRWLRDDHPSNHHRRFQLIKGIPNLNAPRVKIAYPDSDRRDRRAAARGEVPVLEINVNVIKDQVYAMLGREEPFGGMVNFPDWLPDWFYSELTAERRNSKGLWENPKKLRNEAWDLLCYAMGIALHPKYAGIEKIDWNDPPSWARDWDENDLVFSTEQERPFVAQPKVEYDLRELGASLS